MRLCVFDILDMSNQAWDNISVVIACLTAGKEDT